jgi:hypothetical protein
MNITDMRNLKYKYFIPLLGIFIAIHNLEKGSVREENILIIWHCIIFLAIAVISASLATGV